MKYFTMSYDDSFIEDIRLVELMNKYHIKGTFNINTGLYNWQKERHIQPEVQKTLYVGHEVAVHTLIHKHLEDLPFEKVRSEIAGDCDNIKSLTGITPVGMAYPFGTYNKDVIRIAKEEGIKYSRTVISTHDFSVCHTPMELTATCHHNDPNLIKYAKDFIALDGSTEDYVFYLWGHSYEFDEENTQFNFEDLEKFFQIIANRRDIQYLTNKEVLEKLHII